MMLKLTHHHYIRPDVLAEVIFRADLPRLEVREIALPEDSWFLTGDEAIEAWESLRLYFESQPHGPLEPAATAQDI